MASEEELKLVELYGLCAVCGAPRREQRVTSEGAEHLSLVCSKHPLDHDAVA